MTLSVNGLGFAAGYTAHHEFRGPHGRRRPRPPPDGALAGTGAPPAPAPRTSSACCGCGPRPCRRTAAGAGRDTFLPHGLLAALPAIASGLSSASRACAPRIPAPTARSACWCELADGQTVESVLLPRDGLCVSTQVGCAVGCVFCMTGRDGLLRQLGSAEIVAQVALARARRPVKKVVFMGMGEPAHNLDNVLEAIELLGTAGDIGHKNLVFSTVGDPRVFERLPQGRSSRRWPCRCTPPAPTCAHGCCRARRAWRRRSWSTPANATPARPATRSSTSGRCWKASTTATTRSTASCACWRASTPC